MVNFGNILIPLYIYPSPLSKWKTLVDTANAYPNVTFTAVVNPDSGPGVASGCPNSDYLAGIGELNRLPNVKTMGYVHSANKYNCGSSGHDICPCSQPVDAVKQNITTYASWLTRGCKDPKGTTIHIDNIFVDEAPGQDNGACLSYMQNVASHARSLGFNSTRNGTVLFNAGTQPDYRYFGVADTIVVLEASEAVYDTANISALDDGGRYARQAALIIYAHANNTLQRDVQTIMNIQRDAIPNLYLTDYTAQEDTYGNFPRNFSGFAAEVDRVVRDNKAFCSSHSC